jgi:hypothetical protein
LTGAEPDLDAVGLLAGGAADEMDQAREVVSKTSIRIRGSNDSIRSTFDLMGIRHLRFVNPFVKWCAIQNKTANSYVIEITI